MGTTIPSIIWSQIPVGVKMSIGVRLPIKLGKTMTVTSDGRGLSMKVGPNHSRYEVTINLNGHDLYDITLTKSGKEVWSRTDIFAEMLGEVLLRMESQNWG
jgi:hypothetical protein